MYAQTNSLLGDLSLLGDRLDTSVLFHGYVRTHAHVKHITIFIALAITFVFVGEHVTDERCVDEVRRLG